MRKLTIKRGSKSPVLPTTATLVLLAMQDSHTAYEQRILQQLLQEHVQAGYLCTIKPDFEEPATGYTPQHLRILEIIDEREKRRKKENKK